MPVDVHRHLDAAVPEQVLDIGQRGTLLDQRCCGAEKAMKAQVTELGGIEALGQLPTFDVVHIQDRPALRSNHPSWVFVLSFLQRGLKSALESLSSWVANSFLQVICI